MAKREVSVEHRKLFLKYDFLFISAKFYKFKYLFLWLVDKIYIYIYISFIAFKLSYEFMLKNE